MSQGIDSGLTIPEELLDLYALVRPELEHVEAVLREELASRFSSIDLMLKHGFRLGGKRLRPALVLLSGAACGPLLAEHVKMAGALEMIHTATLVHDDVLDEATMRRHHQTINARWDNEASVLMGDYLLARAICLTSSLESTYASRVIAEAASAMCQGELRQVGSRGNHGLDEATYLDIIAEKTAALCACCCQIGAHHAGGSESQCEMLRRFGHDLGVAFQIVDDVLDVRGDEQKTGKSLGTDLEKQKATLPLIRLLEQATPSQRAELIEILSANDGTQREALKPWWERSDAIDYTRARAVDFVRRAVEHLSPLPASPAKESLCGVAEFVVSRQT